MLNHMWDRETGGRGREGGAREGLAEKKRDREEKGVEGSDTLRLPNHHSNLQTPPVV